MKFDKMLSMCCTQNLRDTNQYVKSELDALEHEQLQIDNQAADLEMKLRRVMNKGQGVDMIFCVDYCLFIWTDLVYLPIAG